MSNVKNMENKEKMDNIAAELQSLFTEFESLNMNTLEKAKKMTEQIDEELSSNESDK